jgi:predicted ATPase
MLTRLQVSGFKNLVDVEVHFGPFTCIFGENAVGKSNLFDAIRFLALLADHPTMTAALSVRTQEGGKSTDLRSLFHRVGTEYDSRMSFVADMIIPAEGTDDLEQKAQASITFVRYTLTLEYRQGGANPRSLGSLELVEEKLEHINIGEGDKLLQFPHRPAWRKSILQGRRTSPFISTESEGSERIIKLHQDGGPGRTLSRQAATLPRTVLSTTTAAENPTASLVRKEMRSWILLQLEPSALRRPDAFTAPYKLGSDGSHLAATLYHLAREPEFAGATEDMVLRDEIQEPAIYAEVANRLSELIDDVRAVSVDRDEQRGLLTLQIVGRDHTPHPAQSLSDGTLRFLALTVLALDPETQGVICLEEPENGIHPERLPAMLQLLQAIATDPAQPVGPDNPLRQVIVNTHSPAVVAQVPADSVLMAQLKETCLPLQEGETVPRHFRRAAFSCLQGTWREKVAGDRISLVPRGKLLNFLEPVPKTPSNGQSEAPPGSEAGEAMPSQRVIDRPEIQMELKLPE